MGLAKSILPLLTNTKFFLLNRVAVMKAVSIIISILPPNSVLWWLVVSGKTTLNTSVSDLSIFLQWSSAVLLRVNYLLWRILNFWTSILCLFLANCSNAP